MSDFCVANIFKARKGRETDLENLLKGLVNETHKEKGCKLYALYRSQADPQSFYLIEKWASANDFQSHLKSPHVGQALAVKEELIEFMDISPLLPIPMGDKKKNAY